MNRPNSPVLRRGLTVLLLLALGCGVGGDVPAQRTEPVVELPPPLIGGGPASATPAPTPTPESVADPDDIALPDPAQDAFGPPWLRVLVSQGNRAELDPCGCPGSPSGGMARRAVLVQGLRRALGDPLILEGPTCLSRAVLGIEDVGGAERRRARAVFDSLAVSRPDAFFPGQADFEVLALGELSSRAAAAGIPLIASNLAAPPPGVKDRLVVERGGRRALFLGLIGAARNASQAEALPLVDATPAAARILSDERSRGPVDFVVVITDAEKRELADWHAAALDADVWFVPPGLRRDGKYTREDGRIVVRADPLGRSFRRVDVAFSGPAGRGVSPGDEFPLIEVAKVEREHVYATLIADDDPETRRRAMADLKHRRGLALREAAGETPGHRVAVSDVLIHPDLPMDARVESIIGAFNEERLGSIAATVAAAPQAPKGRVFQGMDACTECHPAEFAQWGRSPHAGAWKTLTEAGQTRNPDCLGCHTTGFADPGGWVEPAEGRHLFNVQCEACHGPMDLHVGQTGRKGFRADPGVTVTEQTCVRCHDAENSPDFDYATYAPRVAHAASAEDR